MKKQSGIVILYALLIIALITAIGISISIIIIRELKLTQNMHYATLAYYAAESGVEKALYTVKTSRDTKNLSDTIDILKSYDQGLDNGSKYNDKQTDIQQETVLTTLAKDQYTQVDLYNYKQPELGAGVESLWISWSGAPWLEISYVEWIPGNPVDFGIQRSYRSFYNITSSPVTIAGQDEFPKATSNYRVRIKALYEEASNLEIKAYNIDDPSNCPPNNKPEECLVDLPSYVVVKAVGNMGEFSQSLTALVPWNTPLFGLYDYVLYSEGQIEKKIIVGQPIYTSGAIQAESALTGSCTSCRKYNNSCPDWKAVCCAENASCTIDAAGTGTCKIEGTNSTHWVLPTPSYVQPAEKYYLSIRANYIGTGSRKMQVILGDTCKDIGDQKAGSNGWVSCTLPEDDFTITPNVNIMFKQNITGGTGEVDVDWYQLSSYKIFDDCLDVSDCTIPTPLCGDCLCSPGEPSCSDDAIDCTAGTCQDPVCVGGCNTTPKPDNTTDPGKCDSPNTCCGGACCSSPNICCTSGSGYTCQAPACINNIDCQESPPNYCTTDTCNNPGGGVCPTCTHSDITQCINDDGCCPDPVLCQGIDNDCSVCGNNDCETGENNINCCQDCPCAGVLICCNQGAGYACQNPVCKVDSDCGAGCTNYCENPNTCNATCKVRSCGTADGCCPAGCTNPPDPDCTIPLPWPTREYLRYIALDENAANVANIIYPISTGTAGKSQRQVPVWQDRTFTTAIDLRAVHAADSTHLWAAGGTVGVNGLIIYSGDGGQTWTNQTTGTTRFSGIWSFKNGSNYEYWVVGDAGKILHCTANCTTGTPTFVTQDFGTDNLNAIHGLDTTHIWAAGANGTVLFYNGTWAKIQNSGTTNILYGIWAYDSNNVWAVGASGTIRYCNSSCGNITSTWNSQTSPSSYLLTSVSGIDVSHVWTSGRCSPTPCTSSRLETIQFYNGSSWAKQTVPIDGDLYGVGAYKEPTSNLYKAIATGVGLNNFYFNSLTSTWYSQTIGNSLLHRAAFVYNWQNMWLVGTTGTGNVVFGNAPENPETMNIGYNFNQSWYTGTYTQNKTFNAGNYYARFYVTAKNNVGSNATIFKISFGYCDNYGGTGTICDESSDFHAVLTSAAFTFTRTFSPPAWYPDATGLLIGNLATPTNITCTSAVPCRLWTRIYDSGSANGAQYFTIGVGGAVTGTGSLFNSYILVP